MFKFEDFLLEKTVAEYATDFTLTKDTKLPEKVSAIFKVDNDTYSVVCYKSSKKGLYKVVVGWVPNEYIKLWKVKPQHLRTVMATTLKVLDYAVDDIGVSYLSGIAMKLPDTAKPSHVKIIEMLVRKYYNDSLRFIPVTPPKDIESKEIYTFIARKTADIKKVFRNKEFKDYNFDPDAPVLYVPQEALVDAEPNRPLNLNRPISREPLVTRGTEISLVTDDPQISKLIANKDAEVIASTSRTVKKKNGMPVGFLADAFRKISKNLTEKPSVEDLADLMLYASIQGQPISYAKGKDLLDNVTYVSSTFEGLMVSGFPDKTEREKVTKLFGIDNMWNLTSVTNDTATYLATKYVLSSENAEEVDKKISTLKDKFSKEESVFTENILKNPEENAYLTKIKNQASDKTAGNSSLDIYYFGEDGHETEYFAKILRDDVELQNFANDVQENKNLSDEIDWKILKEKMVSIVTELKNKKLMGIDISTVNKNLTQKLIELINNSVEQGNLSKYNRIYCLSILKGGGYVSTRAEKYNPIESNSEESLDIQIDFKIDPIYSKNYFVDILNTNGLPETELAGKDMLNKYHDSEQFRRMNKISNGKVSEYTGSAYNIYNPALRKMLNEKEKYLSGSDNGTEWAIDSLEQSLQMMDGFSLTKPTEEDIIVFRASKFPSTDDPVDLKDFYVDPGFLSTSSSSRIACNFGGDRGTRFMIILPKGSKVIFANGSSENPGEDEIILPPYSVLKPIKSVTKGKIRFVQCVYIGNGMESYKQTLEKDFEALAKRKYMSYINTLED